MKAKVPKLFSKLPIDENALWERLVAQAKADLEANPEAVLEADLAAMEALAAHAVKEDKIEGAVKYAEKIMEKARLVRKHVQDKNSIGAAHEALRLAEYWVELRATAMFGNAVREKVKRREAASDHSDEAILAAVAAHPKRIDAAAELDIDPSQVRKRLAAIKKRAR